MRFEAKKILFLVIVTGVLVGCLQGQTPVQSKNDAPSKKISFPNLTLDICEARGRKYRVSVKGDTAEIKSEPYEDFGGTVLCFEWKKLRSFEAFVKFKFGFLQYLFDDRPAQPLKFNMETDWAALEINDQSVLIPQTYDNFPGVSTVFEFLGFEDEDSFDNYFERRYLGSVTAESLKIQRATYEATRDPKERKRLRECCPEYIEQAENFLKKGGDELQTLEGLSLEPYRSKTTIEIRGETQEGERFVYYIIDENG